jgi:hypothetical protein
LCLNSSSSHVVSLSAELVVGQWEVRRVLVAVVVVLEGIVVHKGMVEMSGSHTWMELVAAKH